jgi:inosose dehydratase
MNTFKRRNFLGLIPSLALLNEGLAHLPASKYPISCNSYNWFSFYSRENKTWGENLDADIQEFAKTGIKAYEPGIDNAEHATKIIKALKANGLSMPSIYVNSVLHVEDEAQKAIDNIMAIAKVVKSFGTKIFVTNPTPIKWGGDELKTDKQLIFQAKMLDSLGQKLKAMGITLAYHTHDIELKAGAREFHHMLQNTKPEHMSFCFDVHWVYRGSADSNLAVFDVLKMYGNRIVELHVRQSVNGIWSETFTAAGDIDYIRFAKELAAKGIHPHIVIEQCVEEKSPKTLEAVAAHIVNLKEISRVFGR